MSMAGSFIAAGSLKMSGKIGSNVVVESHQKNSPEHSGLFLFINF